MKHRDFFVARHWGRGREIVPKTEKKVSLAVPSNNHVAEGSSFSKIFGIENFQLRR